MSSSMTGYIQYKKVIFGGFLFFEMHSVNHKYLDITFKLSDELKIIECDLLDIIKNNIIRGKISCTVLLEKSNKSINGLNINKELIDEILMALEYMHKSINYRCSISLVDILKWPNVIEKDKINYNIIYSEVLLGFDIVLKKFLNIKIKEGLFLRLVLKDKIDTIINLICRIKLNLPEVLLNKSKFIKSKVYKIDVRVNSVAFERELICFIQKHDVTEEIDRLEIYLMESNKILEGTDSIGRKFDFYMQEINREISTVINKNVSSIVSILSIEIKLLLVQMREQAQNIE